MVTGGTILHSLLTHRQDIATKVLHLGGEDVAHDSAMSLLAGWRLTSLCTNTNSGTCQKQLPPFSPIFSLSLLCLSLSLSLHCSSLTPTLTSAPIMSKSCSRLPMRLLILAFSTFSSWFPCRQEREGEYTSSTELWNQDQVRTCLSTSLSKGMKRPRSSMQAASLKNSSFSPSAEIPTVLGMWVRNGMGGRGC